MAEHKANNMIRLFKRARPFVPRLFLAMLSMLVVALCTAAIAFLMKPMLDEIFTNRDLNQLYRVTGLVILAFALKAIFFVNQAYQVSFVGQTIVKDLRVDLYKHLQSLSLSFHHRHPSGKLTSRITNDINLIQNAVSSGLTSFVLDILTALGLMGVILYRDWRLALASFLVIPLGAYVIYFSSRIIRSLAKKTLVNMADLTAILLETFQGVRIVKAFNMEEYELARLTNESGLIQKDQTRLALAQSFSSALIELLVGFGIAGVILYGGLTVVRGLSTPGAFISFLAALIMLYEPIRRLSRLNVIMQQGAAAAERIFAIMDEDSEIEVKDNALALTSFKDDIEFEDVSFDYGDKQVINGLSLKIKAGESVAFVGSSGAGKTTLLGLLPRFYDPTQGRILIDGIDLRDLTLNSLRKQISVVSQRTILFDDTVENNISYGSKSVNPEKVKIAAEAAYAYDFIKGMPDGFKSMIGERGVRLSGGEGQRLAVARAIMKDAPILILDEATSSLDAESEQEVQQAIKNLMQGRTTFVIAHRLSTIRNLSRIVVLLNGQIVEEGTHVQLMAMKGEYARLYEIQFAEDDIFEEAEAVTLNDSSKKLLEKKGQ